MEDHQMYYHISDMQKTFEKAYQAGFRDGIEFMIKLSNCSKIILLIGPFTKFNIADKSPCKVKSKSISISSFIF